MKKFVVYFTNVDKKPDYVFASEMKADHGLLVFNDSGTTVAVYSMETVLKAVLDMEG